jgi:hypothetical protein
MVLASVPPYIGGEQWPADLLEELTNERVCVLSPDSNYCLGTAGTGDFSHGLVRGRDHCPGTEVLKEGIKLGDCEKDGQWRDWAASS